MERRKESPPEGTLRPRMALASVIVGLGLLAACGSGEEGAGEASTTTTNLAVPCLDAGDQAAGAEGAGGYRTSVPSGTYSSGAASYTGPITLAWRVDAGPSFYEGPDGSHGTDAACAAASVGDPWDVIATSSGTNEQGSTLQCDYTGEYRRTGMAVEVSLDGECAITERGSDGSDEVLDDPTNEERTATLADCTGPAAMANCTTVDAEYQASDG